MRLPRSVASCCVAICLLAAAPLLRAEVAKAAVKFKDGDRVCFIGDSITHGGGFGYHSQIALFYATRFPQMRIGYWNCGISGDSAAGAVKRYVWDIAPHKPTVATIMLGMNDVSRNLYAMDASGAKVEAQRQAAIENHVARMAELAELLTKDGATLIFITPSIYDQTGTQKTENLFGVNFALGICGYEAHKLASKYNAGVAEFHLLLSRLNALGQAKDPNYTIVGPDRVHPGAPGHLVMAYAFLKAQGMGRCVSLVEINAAKKELSKQENCSVEILQFKDGIISFNCLEKALPFPVESGAKPALDLVPFSEDLNQELLKVGGLEAGDYELLIDGESVLKRPAADFTKGVNLALVAETPQYKQAIQVLSDLKTRADIYSSKLRTFAAVRLFLLSKLTDRSPEAEKKALEENLEKNKKTKFTYGVMQIENYMKYAPDEAKFQKAADELLEKAYSENQPKSHRFELKRVQ
ncbi:MAG: SGNH/GDSL hydrolase family protein [Verrucomicrobia bacterium]|nr:SGNH/GDSL hydrolase family protein [Verrucomicrobiota bacterium]